MKQHLSFIFLLILLSVQARMCLALTLQEQILTVNGKTVQLQVPQGMRVDFLTPLHGSRFLTLGPGSFHGMPWFQYYNGAFRSGECASSSPPRSAGEATPLAVTFDARSTPEGITFVTGYELNEEFSDNALVCYTWFMGNTTRRE